MPGANQTLHDAVMHHAEVYHGVVLLTEFLDLITPVVADHEVDQAGREES